MNTTTLLTNFLCAALGFAILLSLLTLGASSNTRLEAQAQTDDAGVALVQR